jgi:methyl-accepting chemotaxis protein
MLSQSFEMPWSKVSQATNEMNAGSHQVETSAVELSKLAEHLNEMVGRFKIST